MEADPAINYANEMMEAVGLFHANKITPGEFREKIAEIRERKGRWLRGTTAGVLPGLIGRDDQ